MKTKIITLIALLVSQAAMATEVEFVANPKGDGYPILLLTAMEASSRAILRDSNYYKANWRLNDVCRALGFAKGNALAHEEKFSEGGRFSIPIYYDFNNTWGFYQSDESQYRDIAYGGVVRRPGYHVGVDQFGVRVLSDTIYNVVLIKSVTCEK